MGHYYRAAKFRCRVLELNMKKPVPVESASARIDERIKELSN